MILNEEIHMTFSTAGIVSATGEARTDAEMADGVAKILEKAAAAIRRRGRVEGRNAVHNEAGDPCGTYEFRVTTDSIKDLR